MGFPHGFDGLNVLLSRVSDVTMESDPEVPVLRSTR